MQKNVDFVAYAPQAESSWGFYIPGKAKKASEVCDEILRVTARLLEISEGFFLPTGLEYSLYSLPDDLLANDTFSSAGFDVRKLDSTQKCVGPTGGFSYARLAEDARCSSSAAGSSKYIRRIEIEGKTRFTLKDRDLYVDKNSLEVYLSGSNPEKSASLPNFNPVWIDLIHSSSKSQTQEVERADPAYYQLIVWTYTDMWFDNTAIGRCNCYRLRHFLNGIVETFHVTDYLFMSDRYSEEALKDLVFGSG